MTRTKSEQARQKTKWLRSEPYLAWVRTLPSVVSGQSGCVAHHLTGYGSRGSTKVHDFWTIPLTGNEHNLGVGSLHSGVETWEAKHGSQWKHVADVLYQAIKERLFVPQNSFGFGDVLLAAKDEGDEVFCMVMVELIESGRYILDKKTAQGRNNIL